MSKVGSLERVSQERIIALFQERLGYNYQGNWQDRPNNQNIEFDLLVSFLQKQGYNDKLIERALRELKREAALGDGTNLYDANKEVYRLLRYGVKVREEAGGQHQTVWLVDWKNCNNNDFSIAEEVTVVGENTKRPDLVIYVNGIALGVLELKRSTVGLTEGIRQNLQNQRKDFIRPFFSTTQLLMAGNDTQGLRYGTIETSEKYYLEWKEEGGIGDCKLDRHLSLLCEKSRLLEIIHDFIIFDAGVKKICRHNQYFGVKESKNFIRRREGGIIWHTQGSGKSLTMVWLAKWIRENREDARVLIITDRTELDEQIERIYRGVDEEIYRTASGADLIYTLNRTEQWLMCSLVHKFGGANGDELSDEDFDKYIQGIKQNMMSNFQAKGDLYVFVDECHRTQSGKLHSAMKHILPNALFIGFTGTPLLKGDKQKSLEIFGPYIHTYKYDEAINDGVILDLHYEARDIDQTVTSPEKIDIWFEAKTKGLTDYAQAQLKRRWGTMRKVQSSQPRIKNIAQDILFDMETRARLADGRGNAILVSGSIYQACKYFEVFDQTELAGKCAIITSYKPSAQNIKNEESGEGYTERLRQYNIYRKMLADFFDEPAEQAVERIGEFEKRAKEKFIAEPGQMRLLIVVDKLLTGFDAPSATYLYIDKKMQDHGLFQAVCRVNRLDGEDKEYGYIIDYKDLFNSLESSLYDYTCGAFDDFVKEDVAGLLQNRLEKAKERLDEKRETVKTLCEGVERPKDTAAYLRYFCAKDTANKDALKENEARRLALYKETASFIRAYAALASEMEAAGYSADVIAAIKAEVAYYEKVRLEVKMGSGDYIDLKAYEPAMRHLIDTYIHAEASEKISAFDDLSLIKLIALRGEAALDELPEGIRHSEESVAETIENNMRKVIIDGQPVNPIYYERMSALLDALIKERKEQALKYKEYLLKIVALTEKICHPEKNDSYPKALNTEAKRTLYDNLEGDEQLAIIIDTMVQNTKRDSWRGNVMKEKEIKNKLATHVAEDKLDYIFEILKNQNEY